eukprot:12521864-Alexandrium_andersonii.AAC.1
MDEAAWRARRRRSRGVAENSELRNSGVARASNSGVPKLLERPVPIKLCSLHEFRTATPPPHFADCALRFA